MPGSHSSLAFGSPVVKLSAYLRTSVCVCERKRERVREDTSALQKHKKIETSNVRTCVCEEVKCASSKRQCVRVCVCVCERERERERD